MGSMKMVHNVKVLNLLPPEADRFGAAGGAGPRGSTGGASPVTAVVDVTNYRHVTFIIAFGTVAASTITPTLEGCNALYSPTIHTELPFEYYPGGASVTSGLQAEEKLGTMALATTSGILTTSGCSDQLIVIEVDVAEAEAAYVATNAGGVLAGLRLRCTETKDAAAEGAVIAILSEPRFKDEGDNMPQAIANAT